MTTVPVGEARDHLSELLGEVERTHERVSITRHGRPIAVLIPPDDLEIARRDPGPLGETLDLLSRPGAVEAIREGRADVAAGRIVPAEEVAVPVNTSVACTPILTSPPPEHMIDVRKF